MSRPDFRGVFLENMLNFLWRQWSVLGVLGEARGKDRWAIDPEALLIFTLPIARHEPRLFDEVMDWLTINGRWMDMQRLRGILRRGEHRQCRLVGAAAAFLASQGGERKWENLATKCAAMVPKEAESLFKDKAGKPYSLPSGNLDESFAGFGFQRSPLRTSGKSREVIPTAQVAIRFMLRSLFGMGSRSECVLYLLTHEGGHPAEVAAGIGLSIRGTQDALIELSKSGLVLTRSRGRRKIEYWLPTKRWWTFLTMEEIEGKEPLVWLDWIALFSALSTVWETLEQIHKAKSDYLKSSKLREAMEAVGNEFAVSGLPIPSIPGRAVRPEDYQKAFEEFLKKVFDTSEVGMEQTPGSNLEE